MSDTCCADEQITSGAFAEVLLKTDENRPFPVSASLDLTNRCNLKCRHCYLRHEAIPLRDRPAQDVERTLSILRDFGVLFLVFTGGDPFCRPDFRALYQTAKRLGFFLTIFSNGTLLDDDLMDFLAALPPRRIELTAYGHTRETYEAVTRVPGSYPRFRKAVDGLLRRGILVRLKSMILRTNAHEREAMRDWALALGCDYRYDAIVHPCLNGDASPLAERLPPDVIAQFRHRDRERLSKDGDLRAGVPAPPRRQLFECGAGILTVHVDADHQLHPCISWRLNPFDLAAHPALADWKAHIEALRNLPAPGGACDACKHRARCQSCAAYSLLETGSPSGVPTFFCRLAEAEEALETAGQKAAPNPGIAASPSL